MITPIQRTFLVWLPSPTKNVSRGFYKKQWLLVTAPNEKQALAKIEEWDDGSYRGKKTPGVRAVLEQTVTTMLGSDKSRSTIGARGCIDVTDKSKRK